MEKKKKKQKKKKRKKKKKKKKKKMDTLAERESLNPKLVKERAQSLNNRGEHIP